MTIIETGLPQGLKYDYGKPRMDLLPFDALYEVAKVLSFGTEKYSENSWKKVEAKRYEAAMLRHLAQYKAGELLDKESGLTHLSHLACNALFILALSCQGEE